MSKKDMSFFDMSKKICLFNFRHVIFPSRTEPQLLNFSVLISVNNVVVLKRHLISFAKQNCKQKNYGKDHTNETLTHKLQIPQISV